MLANYGYEDASGNYYISINTDVCAECEEKACIKACPAGLFETEIDDYDDEVVTVKERFRNVLKTQCSGCKPAEGRPEILPCQAGCPETAVKHSW